VKSPARNILIIGLNYLPEPIGIAPYTTGLAAGLSRRGHQVRVRAGGRAGAAAGRGDVHDR
jgi:hypothetical protein